MLDYIEKDLINLNAIQLAEQLSEQIKNYKNPEYISLLEELVSLDLSLALEQNDIK